MRNFCFLCLWANSFTLAHGLLELYNQTTLVMTHPNRIGQWYEGVGLNVGSSIEGNLVHVDGSDLEEFCSMHKVIFSQKKLSLSEEILVPFRQRWTNKIVVCHKDLLQCEEPDEGTASRAISAYLFGTHILLFTFPNETDSLILSRSTFQSLWSDFIFSSVNQTQLFAVTTFSVEMSQILGIFLNANHEMLTAKVSVDPNRYFEVYDTLIYRLVFQFAAGISYITLSLYALRLLFLRLWHKGAVTTIEVKASLILNFVSLLLLGVLFLVDAYNSAGVLSFQVGFSFRLLLFGTACCCNYLVAIHWIRAVTLVRKGEHRSFSVLFYCVAILVFSLDILTIVGFGFDALNTIMLYHLIPIMSTVGMLVIVVFFIWSSQQFKNILGPMNQKIQYLQELFLWISVLKAASFVWISTVAFIGIFQHLYTNEIPILISTHFLLVSSRFVIALSQVRFCKLPSYKSNTQARGFQITKVIGNRDDSKALPFTVRNQVGSDGSRAAQSG